MATGTLSYGELAKTVNDPQQWKIKYIGATNTTVTPQGVFGTSEVTFYSDYGTETFRSLGTAQSQLYGQSIMGMSAALRRPKMFAVMGQVPRVKTCAVPSVRVVKAFARHRSAGENP